MLAHSLFWFFLVETSLSADRFVYYSCSDRTAAVHRFFSLGVGRPEAVSGRKELLSDYWSVIMLVDISESNISWTDTSSDMDWSSV